jgi:hypothetical protein
MSTPPERKLPNLGSLLAKDEQGVRSKGYARLEENWPESTFQAPERSHAIIVPMSDVTGVPNDIKAERSKLRTGLY